VSKLPSFQFYPGDWLKDPSLRRCTKSAKGVWIDMICLSFECEERGVFATSGVPWPDGDIVAAVGGDNAEVTRALEELLAKGVCSRNQSGAIFCRRVVRDEMKRRKCSEAGKAGGGNPALTFKGDPKGGVKGGVKQNPKASSSSSSSESNSLINNAGDDLTFIEGHSKQFEDWWQSYPAGKRTGKRACWNLWPKILVEIQAKIKCSESQAAIHLIQRTKLFASSDKGRDAVYCWSSERFLQDGHFDDELKSWEKTSERRDTGRGRHGGIRPEHAASNEIGDDLAKAGIT